MIKDTLLDARIHDVLRALPTDQREEILYQDLAFYKAVQGVEYGFLTQPMHSDHRERREPYLKDYIPKLASQLVWKDLHVSEAYGFPGLTPGRAMHLGRIATVARETIQAGAPNFEPEKFTPLASGVVGLHGAVIGSEEALKMDDDAKTNIDQVVEALRDNFVRPLYEGRFNRR